MEPDVPDTRKMLIRVRRKQAMSALAARYGVSLGQLKAWNRTHRNEVMAGQVIVLHVPVGKAVPAEPGPQKIAAAVPDGARVERVDARAADAKPKSRGAKVAAGKGRIRVTIAKTAAHAAKPARKSVAVAKPAEKSSKVADTTKPKRKS